MTIALVSLAVAGIPLVTTMGLMAAIAVVRRGAGRADAAAGRAGDPGAADQLAAGARTAIPRATAQRGLWAKWADEIAKQSRSLAGLAALAILIPLMIPLLSLTLGQQDTAALSTSTTARRAYDLISENFGPGVNGPLLIAVTLGSPGHSRHVRGQRSSRVLRRRAPTPSDPRLQTSEGRRLDPAWPRSRRSRSTRRDDRVLQRDLEDGPSDGKTTDLVDHLRSSTIPSAEKGTEHDAYVGGQHRRVRRPGDRRSRASCRCRSWS